MSEQHYLTREGADTLRAELNRLKGPERDALARRLREAIQMGDLSENADYHKAKEDQGFLEGRIQELEYILSRAVVVDSADVSRTIVQVGTRVTVQEEDYPPETYYLVGAKEADPSTGRISNESPIGRSLIGAKEGAVVTAQTPGGQIRLTVLKIE